MVLPALTARSENSDILYKQESQPLIIPKAEEPHVMFFDFLSKLPSSGYPDEISKTIAYIERLGDKDEVNAIPF